MQNRARARSPCPWPCERALPGRTVQTAPAIRSPRSGSSCCPQISSSSLILPVLFEAPRAQDLGKVPLPRHYERLVLNWLKSVEGGATKHAQQGIQAILLREST